MAFGLSFGKKSAKTSSTSTIDKTETGSQTGTETTLGQRTGTQTTTGTTSNLGTGTSATTGTSTQQQTAAGEQRQTGVTRSLSQNVLGGLESAVTGLLTNILDPNTGDRAMITRGVDAMGNFDVDSFVQGTVRQAMAQQGTRLDEMLGSIFSRVGGTEDTNSMASLLAARERENAAANIAGVQAQAQATGADIAAKRLGATATSLEGAGAAMLPAILGILKGGETSTDLSTLTQELTNIMGQTAGTTQTAEQQTQNQAVTTATTESLVQAVLNALNQTTHTTGTETTKGKTSETGFGAGFSM